MRLFSIDLDGADPELVTDRCWAAGVAGIWETDGNVWRVGVDDEHVDAFVAAVADLGPVDVTEIEAVELATRDVVVDGVALTVPPTVFGDGDHPTTAGCLEALGEVVQPGDLVLDVGCGSGVLSVAAALAGAAVTAIDIDEVAVDATVANAAGNGVSVAASTTPLAEVSGSYDVVVANMTAGSIGPLLADLVRCMNGRTHRGRGQLIVSGILDDQWPGIESELRSLFGGRKIAVSHTSLDGWVTGSVRLAGS